MWCIQKSTQRERSVEKSRQGLNVKSGEAADPETEPRTESPLTFDTSPHLIIPLPPREFSSSLSSPHSGDSPFIQNLFLFLSAFYLHAARSAFLRCAGEPPSRPVHIYTRPRLDVLTPETLKAHSTADIAGDTP